MMKAFITTQCMRLVKFNHENLCFFVNVVPSYQFAKLTNCDILHDLHFITAKRTR